MSLGTDQGFLMSPELLKVAERAKHDPETGGRHPGVSTPDPDQGVVLRGRFAPAAGDGASVTWRFKGFHDALVRRLQRLTRKRPQTGLGHRETASTEEPSGGNLLARFWEGPGGQPPGLLDQSR